MANLKIDIKEFITLNGDKYDSNNSYTLTDIDEISKRIVTIPTSSIKEIIGMSTSIGSGTFIESDVRYMRFTNLGAVRSGSYTGSNTVPIMLTFKNENNDTFGVKLDEGISYVYSGVSNEGVVNTLVATSSAAGINTSSFGDLVNITATTSASTEVGSVSGASLELFVAST